MAAPAPAVLFGAAAAAACWAVLERRCARSARTAAAQVAAAASTCSLTGLARRERWMEWVTEAATAEHGEIAFADLDGFKQVNDKFGHQIGDALLAAVAARLVEALPGSRIGRAGGDEFVLLGSEVAWDEVADRLRQPYSLQIGPGEDELSVEVGISIGVARCDGRQAREILATADHAMYQAKRDGGGIHHAGTDNCTPAPLTAREEAAAELVARGCTNRVIAQRLVVEESTVKWYVRGLRNKLNCRGGRGEIVAALQVLGYGQADGIVEQCAHAS